MTLSIFCAVKSDLRKFIKLLLLCPYKALVIKNPVQWLINVLVEHFGYISFKSNNRCYSQSSVAQCPLCKRSHSIRNCSQFIDKTVNERFQLAKNNRLHVNYLGVGHSVALYPSKHKCQTCQQSHHTLLNFETP